MYLFEPTGWHDFSLALKTENSWIWLSSISYNVENIHTGGGIRKKALSYIGVVDVVTIMATHIHYFLSLNTRFVMTLTV